MWANRNGYFYVLDRTSGECLVAKPYVRVNWSSGLDENCRPIITPQPDGMPTYPGNQGDKLVPAFLQSTHWPLLFQCLGGLRNDLSLGRAGIYAGQGLSGRWVQCAGAGAGCTDDRHRPYQSGKQLDG